MSLSETAQLAAELNLKDNTSRTLGKIQGRFKNLNVQTKLLQQGLGKVGSGLQKGFKRAIGFLALNIKKGLDSLVELEDVTLATNQVIKSTRGIANVTGKAVRKLAEKYEDLTTVDDKVIQGAENLLLSFTNVRKKAFEPALAAALDMSEALDMDLNAAVKSLGKALNDPIAGISRLTRLGVTFTEQEKKKIEQLVKSGNLLGAQTLILGKLNRLYGGRAANAAKGYRGQMNRMNDAVEELQMNLAGPLLKPLTKVTQKLAAFAKSKDVQDGLKDLGVAIGDMFTDENIATGIEAIKGGFTFIKDLPWDSIKTGLEGVATVAGRAVDIFKSLPPGVQTALVTLLAANKLTGGLVASGLKDIASFALRSLTTITAGVVTVIGKSVIGPGGAIPAAGAAAPAVAAAGGLGAKMFLGGVGGAAILNSLLRESGPLQKDEYSGETGLPRMGLTDWDIEQIRKLWEPPTDPPYQSFLKGLDEAIARAGGRGMAPPPAAPPNPQDYMHGPRNRPPDAGAAALKEALVPPIDRLRELTAAGLVNTEEQLRRNRLVAEQSGAATVNRLELAAQLLRAVGIKVGEGSSGIIAKHAETNAKIAADTASTRGALAALQATLAAKKMSFTANLTTKFEVSGREVATAVQRVTNLGRMVAE